MATTSYFTVNGRLLGQSDAGVRIGYIRDHLGSVVATTSSGTVVNSYTYKPYGGVLTKTGTAADPRFLWCGGHGYRQTESAFTSQYVRARHYAETTGSWSSRDPLFSAAQANSYAYADDNPVGRMDRSGLLSHEVVTQARVRSNCGWSEIEHKWKIEPEYRGFIVMRVKNVCSVKYCDGVPKSSVREECCALGEFWEAWRVDKNRIYAGEDDITDWDWHHDFRQPDEGKCTYGQIVQVGRAKFIPSQSMTLSGFTQFSAINRHVCAGSLLVSEVKPSWWTDENTIELKLFNRHECCCSDVPVCLALYGSCPSGPCLPRATVSGY